MASSRAIFRSAARAERHKRWNNTEDQEAPQRFVIVDRVSKYNGEPHRVRHECKPEHSAPLFPIHNDPNIAQGIIGVECVPIRSPARNCNVSLTLPTACAMPQIRCEPFQTEALWEKGRSGRFVVRTKVLKSSARADQISTDADYLLAPTGLKTAVFRSSVAIIR